MQSNKVGLGCAVHLGDYFTVIETKLLSETTIMAFVADRWG